MLNIKKSFKAALKRAGIEDFRFHDLRHTFASHWVMRGGDLFKLQKILGHSSIEITLRYAHLAPHAFADDYGRLGGPIEEQSGALILPMNTAPR